MWLFGLGRADPRWGLLGRRRIAVWLHWGASEDKQRPGQVRTPDTGL